MRQLKISERYTLRNDTISRYLSELDKSVPLNSDNEYQVALAAQKGDENAIQKLITSNLRFVVSVAKQYSSDPEVISELIAQGNIGLIDSAKTFDPSRGFRFISYAVWHIRKEMMLYLNNSSRTVRLPSNVVQLISKIKKIESSLANKLDREPTVLEIFDELSEQGHQTDYDRLISVMTLGSRAVPLDYSGSDDMLSPIEKIDSGVRSSDKADSADALKLFPSLLNNLNSYEREVVLRYHGVNKPYSESFNAISRDYGKTPEWARTIYKKAIKKASSKANRLKLSMSDFELQ